MNDPSNTLDTIAAPATPPGVGGIGIVRVSGPAVRDIAAGVIGTCPKPRQAVFAAFRDAHGEVIDRGIALFFPGPGSFTGEDVLELQGHGGPVVMQMLMDRVREFGARDARPGEFSERAFLNGRLDLAQAEAIADLIESGTQAAARAAQRSLDGEFSQRVNALQQEMTALRVFVEAALDFPEEEIDFLAESDVAERLEQLLDDLDALAAGAQRGQLLHDGVTAAIIGLPNAGKSSLLNVLAGRETAIVTDLPGTTRDVVRASVSLDGLPMHVADTAGIRDTGDVVEAEGVRRARQALADADLVLLVLDPEQDASAQEALAAEVPEGATLVRVHNKIDRSGEPPRVDAETRRAWLSARDGTGLDGLVGLIRDVVGAGAPGQGSFSARARHLDALARARARVAAGRGTLEEGGDTLAEELRLAQNALGEITGQVLPDDLLGEIFASFCIGK